MKVIPAPLGMEEARKLICYGPESVDQRWLLVFETEEEAEAAKRCFKNYMYNVDGSLKI